MSVISPLSSVKTISKEKSNVKPFTSVNLKQLPILAMGGSGFTSKVRSTNPLNVNSNVDSVLSNVLNRKQLQSYSVKPTYGPNTGIGAGLPKSSQKSSQNPPGKDLPGRILDNVMSSSSSLYGNQYTDERQQFARDLLPVAGANEAYNDAALLISDPAEYWRQNSFQDPDNLINNLRAASQLYGFNLAGAPLEAVGDVATRTLVNALSQVGLGEEAGFLLDMTIGSDFEKVEALWNTLDKIIPGTKDVAREVYDSTVGAGVRSVEQMFTSDFWSRPKPKPSKVTEDTKQAFKEQIEGQDYSSGVGQVVNLDNLTNYDFTKMDFSNWNVNPALL